MAENKSKSRRPRRNTAAKVKNSAKPEAAEAPAAKIEETPQPEDKTKVKPGKRAAAAPKYRPMTRVWFENAGLPACRGVLNKIDLGECAPRQFSTGSVGYRLGGKYYLNAEAGYHMVKVTVGEQNVTFTMARKKFSSGNSGFFAQQKALVMLGETPIKFQCQAQAVHSDVMGPDEHSFQVLLIAVGSKKWPEK